MGLPALRRPFLIALLCLTLSAAARGELPRTVAEKSDYKATSRHADVIDFCERLAKPSPLVRVGEFGTSDEGRKLPLLILADPPVATPEEALKSKKLVVFAMGNIHAGEVDGKEALLMLARDLATAKEKPLLKDLVLVIAPIFNADGNEKIGKTNRPEQAGPAEASASAPTPRASTSTATSSSWKAPEVRALVRFFNKWDPAVFIDCHTTNGSFHRYTMTYEGGRCPAGDAGGRLVSDEMLPDIRQTPGERRPAINSFFYGNFSRDRTAGKPCRRRRATAPITSACATASPSCRNRTPMPRSKIASWRRGFVQTIFEYTAANQGQDSQAAGRRPTRR